MYSGNAMEKLMSVKIFVTGILGLPSNISVTRGFV